MPPLLLLAALPPSAPPPVPPPERRFAIDGARSRVSASVGFFGIGRKTARFPRVSGSVSVPADGPIRLDVRIDAAALTASDALTERRLKGADFFDVARHPQVSFAGAGLRATGPATGTIDGTLTARGVSRPASVTVRFSRPVAELGTGGGFQVAAATVIDRTAFGMTAYPLIVARRVRITIDAALQPAP